MQVSKPTIRAIQALSAGPRLLGPRLTVRQLSMTGPTTFSSLLTTDKPYTSNRPSRPVRLSGETTIPVPEATETGSRVRHFNTSRSRKAVKDSSTIDFTYIPEFNAELGSTSEGVKVPILPGTEAAKGRGAETEEPQVMQHAIYTVSADGTHVHSPAAIAEAAEGAQSDYQGMVETVTSKLTATHQEGESMTKQILNDFMEDVMELLNPKQTSPKA